MNCCNSQQQKNAGNKKEEIFAKLFSLENLELRKKFVQLISEKIRMVKNSFRTGKGCLNYLSNLC